jgi:hypothetical protein
MNNDKGLHIMNQPRQTSNLKAVQHLFGGTLIWVGAAFLAFMLFVFTTVRVGVVSGEEVGFLLNKITGNVETIDTGRKIFNGLIKEFYVLDKTLQILEMTEVAGRGDRSGKDDLKIKTIDGSDVYVDLKVQYKIDPNMAEEVLATSGPGDAYKTKWARDYVRSICRNHLGELTTEEFYDAGKRKGKLIAARSEVNERLKDFGLIVAGIDIPRRPHFYKEYEDMIKRKKEADQAVHAEHSKAQAAKQKQQTMIVQETNKKNVAVEQFEGEMSQKVIAAEAYAGQIKKGADAYYEQNTVQADARLYELQKEARAITARKTAEADGIMAMKKALEGEGGMNMVRLEYARKLKDIQITGKPYMVQNNVERLELLKGAAAADSKK